MVEARQIPENVQALLRDYVGSLEELLALLFLYKGSGRGWTVQETAEAVGVPVDEARQALANLRAGGLIVGGENVFEYRSEASTATVELLARAYEENQVGVMMLLTANAVERIRTGALRAFADAFVIKGRKNDG